MQRKYRDYFAYLKTINPDPNASFIAVSPANVQKTDPEKFAPLTARAGRRWGVILFHALYSNKTTKKTHVPYAVVHDDTFSRDWDGIDRSEFDVDVAILVQCQMLQVKEVQGLTRLIMRYPEPLASLADLRIKGIDQINPG
ncbi:hypothetical protein [Levilactobacillus acidifarinae]|uniref:Uncharacterized protein n=1 Tax=Levilactobacillus acidifarinae DSM 19394 = JCM 15949 TaxID=1423715 RepID=A0A0R1LFI3_9LACO|nr:hypothetical protein [Levilactobacillus acidifarinae]KRK94540.1 hypothetical protein FD25_GL000508 [Levilactobacillus acidifarinae DSM 19394]GEO68289.1 hypothetical protein LAC03_01990 [Levilactobacillus acidifarinae]